jgi:transposase
MRTKHSQDKLELLESLDAGIISVSDTMTFLDLSKSQIFRLLRRFRTDGSLVVCHGLTGKPSNNRGNSLLKEQVLSLIRDKYYDCGATLASELLEENEGLKVHRETLRLWMRSQNLQVKTRKRKPYRQRRDRKPAFGQMLQIDGSPHEWFGVSRTTACLLNLIDDATSHNLCFFDYEETSYAACTVLWMWIERFGIPNSIYCDRRNAYLSKELEESSGFFGQMCKRLRIQIIPANSPQAKGRVERSNQTHQDRLIPMMRLKDITTIEEANIYLKKHYLHHHNKKFAANIEMFQDIHRKLPQNTTMDSICYLEEPRKVNNDWTIKFKGKTFQITRKHYCPAKSTVIVRYSINGNISLIYRNENLDYKII